MRRSYSSGACRTAGGYCTASAPLSASSIRLFFLVVLLALAPFASCAQTAAASQVVVLEIEGTVEVLKAGAAAWSLATTNQVLQPDDQLRTSRHSRAAVRWTNLSIYRLGPRTTIRVVQPEKKSNVLNLLRGALYFFHRDKPGQHPVQTPTAYAVILGTEFGLEVADNGTTTLSLFDGKVDLRNDAGNLVLASGDTAVVEPGLAPRLLPHIAAINLMQWALYYPGILDPAELQLDDGERNALAGSLAAYNEGDLLAALARYPGGREAVTERESIYRAALLLAVGEVETAAAALRELPAHNRAAETAPSTHFVRSGRAGERRNADLAAALSEVIAAVQFRPGREIAGTATNLATAWMAESYRQQASSKLEAAREAARRATVLSPQFSFAWARLGELEFGFGNIPAARRAVENSLRLAPKNAEALAVRGFLLAAHNQQREARASFEQAIAINGAMGKAWLGRGLLSMRAGHAAAGLEDLQMAATVEPQRALMRSYLGKGFSQIGDIERARHEIEVGIKQDPHDPTGWLYSALVNQQGNRVNEAIRDLERSQELNDNRSVFRSRLLLDHDQAVRGANLASIYQDAGMLEVSVREASRAVNYDYANYSAHLFLANSYDALRDPSQVNLRYETPWLSEYLLANLLSPVGAGTLAQQITREEYSRLFASDRLGFASITEYQSRGDWFQSVAQYGQIDNSAYAIEMAYRSKNGDRPNNDLEQLTLSAKFKQQLTPSDSIYLQEIYYGAESGDLNRYFDQAQANRGVRIKEKQEPLFLAGYHHEWTPGVHSLFLAGRLQDTLEVHNPTQDILIFGRGPGGEVTDVVPTTIEQRYRSELEIYTAEFQQIWQGPVHGITAGLRYQTGEFESRNRHVNVIFTFPFLFPNQREVQNEDFERLSAYAYYRWQVAPPLLLIAGLTYDQISFPENFRYAPLVGGQERDDKFSPKAGFIWTPAARTTVRGGYAQSLGGVGFDQSFQLEPTQVAGFNQAFRSIIPESVTGANAGERFESWNLSLEQKIGRGTYLGLAGEVLRSKADRMVGIYEFFPFVISTAVTEQKLDYEERSLLFTANQLLGNEWSLGLRYRLSQAELSSKFPEVPGIAVTAGGFERDADIESLLHQLHLFAIYNHRCGFFSELGSIWNAQSNHGYNPDRGGDDFWQFNAFAGYRFWKRRAEVRLGILNITDQDYRLSPLNLTADLPRDRTFVAGFRLFF